ncbi:hypothetical protein BJX61DRAFT_535944 [Aspergillus egyptiacus]|nr:hypothetical protein BJX61DRAFT_535944 [Aspergillus egyptiacus]
MKKSLLLTLLKLFPYTILYTTVLPVSCYAEVSEQIQDPSENLDLVSFLSLVPQRHDEIFTEAIELLQSIESPSSCNGIAASKLITSCRSIDQKPDTSINADTYLALEHARSLYAARLAICELTGAGAPIPSPCDPVNVSLSRQKVRFKWYTNNKHETTHNYPISKNTLESCLKSLESRPQWWTSYSNSRQNAVVICQASRTENEKKEILELYKSIVNSSIKLDHGLREALRMAAEESAKYRAFMQSTENLTNEILRDMDRSTLSVRNFVESASQGLKSQFDSISQTILSRIESLQMGFTGIEKDLRESSNEANHLRQTLQDVHDKTLLRTKEIDSKQKRQAAVHNELALTLQSKLESIIQNEITNLAHSVGSVDASLEWSYAVIARILEGQENVSERLRIHESALSAFESRVETLYQIQQQQNATALAMSQLQEETKMNLQISKSFSEQAASEAANLLTMIDETKAKFEDVPCIFRRYLV